MPPNPYGQYGTLGASMDPDAILTALNDLGSSSLHLYSRSFSPAALSSRLFLARSCGGWVNIQDPVSLVSLFELASIVVATFGGYYILCIAIPGGDLSFRTPPVSMAVVAFNCFVTVCVQGYFAGRIKLFSQGSLAGKVIVSLVAMLALTELGSGVGLIYFGFSANSRKLGHFTHGLEHRHVLLLLSISTALADIVTTVTLVYIFRKSTERPKSKGWLGYLIARSIENGAITSVGAVLHFAFYIAMPNTWIHLALAYVNCRLYSNVLLASINANRRLQRQVQAEGDTSVSLSNRSSSKSRLQAEIPPDVSATSMRRHSLPGLCQLSSRIGTRTEAVEFTAINSSLMSDSMIRSERYIANS
ncbi:hypothetical protein FA13DRAFT_1794490 [Coprinellus micaceus]|uniref:DUF6534 domain-containing protein n=1 Tax=Coprinellus micaceus TaxID=71717 RepID=A0A4Y7T154_COPMI|nr:hypothetical protein FA13DRAFT_1794490 [Coprinellus micaceus]